MGCLSENPSQPINTNNQNDKLVGSESERNPPRVITSKHYGIPIESAIMADGGIPRENILPNEQDNDNHEKTLPDIGLLESNDNTTTKYDAKLESNINTNEAGQEDSNNIALGEANKNITEENGNNEAKKANSTANDNQGDIVVKVENKSRVEESGVDAKSETNDNEMQGERTAILDQASDISEEEIANYTEGEFTDNAEVESECERYSYEPIDVKEEVLQEIEKKLNQLEEIPEICYDIPIECFSEDTQHRLCYHLDPESHVTAHSGKSKDYLGLGEWIELEPLFMKYLHRTMMKLKTIEVLGKWITIDTRPHPTIRNFVECMCGEDGIDRPDVVMDLAKHITKDAIAWVRTGSEACTVPQTTTDKSWQLTRHDVVTGKKTYYTSCLVYADEDEGMVQIITKLYKSVSKQALFFLPQFDLKVGKYVFDITAKVIQERCDGRVVFILSEYFFASEVCRFAVQFSRAMDAAADAGNLIPFHLTSKYDHVPRVLKGISGIRWFRKAARKMLWATMTDTILGGRMECEQLECLKHRLLENVENDPLFYLGDPPYDEDTPSPGPPIEVNDPPLTGELSSYDPSIYFEKLEQEVLASARPEESTSKVSKLLKRVKTGTVNAINKLLKKKSKTDSDKCSAEVELEEDKLDKKHSISDGASSTASNPLSNVNELGDRVYSRTEFDENSTEGILVVNDKDEVRNAKDR